MADKTFRELADPLGMNGLAEAPDTCRTRHHWAVQRDFGTTVRSTLAADHMPAPKRKQLRGDRRPHSDRRKPRSLQRAITYFAAHGITRIERLMTDNAWAYRWSLRKVCAEHDIKQKFIKPHRPWQNGKVERLNRTLTTEWAYRQAFTTNTERTAALAPWLEHYNTERRHTALGGKPPTSRLPPT